MESKYIKVVVFVPEESADMMRRVIAEAGGGRMGDYSACSFSTKGIGRFTPEMGAHPSIGEVGKPEMVVEERIEVLCEREILQKVVAAIKNNHPYEEAALDIYPVEQI